MQYDQNKNLIIDTINAALLEHHLTTLNPKKVRTHGGEWFGPCPRCKVRGIPGKNEDRLLVWPERSADGAGNRDDPVFMCRGCTRDDNPTRPWTGDLAQFVQDVYGMTYGEARDFLGFSGNGTFHTSVSLVPTVSITGAPLESWQKRSFQLASDAYNEFWGEKGTYPRKHMMDTRGIQEYWLKKAVIGSFEDTCYKNGSEWGLDGRIKIPRGIVFPEYHESLVNGDTLRELWAIAIRKPKHDIEEEEFLTGKRASKYHLLRKSERGMYGYHWITPGLPVIMVEGQIDALTILQEGQGEFNAVALQSNVGARAANWLLKLLAAPFIIFSFDSDNGGKMALQYWESILPPEKIVVKIPQNGDINAMHQRGESVQKFLRQARDLYVLLHPTVFSVPSFSVEETVQIAGGNELILSETQEDAVAALTLYSDREKSQVSQVDTQKEAFQISTTELNKDTIQSEVTDLLQCSSVCESCGAEVETYDDTGHAWCLACFSARECVGLCLCGRQALYDDHVGHVWCAVHMLGSLLCEQGSQYAYQSCIVPGGKGPTSDHQKEVYGSSFTLEGSESQYLYFVLHMSYDVVWRAVSALRYQHLPSSKRPSVTIANPCSRVLAGCKRDWHVPIQVFAQRPKDAQGKELYNMPYLHAPWKGKSHCIQGECFSWCAKCTGAYYLLEAGEILCFPVIEGGTFETSLGAGYETWKEFVLTRSEFTLTYACDMVRKKFPRVWKDVQAFGTA